MFIVLGRYLKELVIVDEHLHLHRDYLKQGYENNYLLLSGPQNPRIGGVMISNLTDKSELENFLKHDPFYLMGIADYQIVEFNPVQSHPSLNFLLQQGR
jgi:uncharacterized protein YciI